MQEGTQFVLNILVNAKPTVENVKIWLCKTARELALGTEKSPSSTALFTDMGNFVAEQLCTEQILSDWEEVSHHGK